MSTGRLIGLNLLILGIGLTAYFIYQSYQTNPQAAAGPDPAAATAAAIDTAAEDEDSYGFAGEGDVTEASNLLGTKLLLFMVGGVLAGILIVIYIVPVLAGAVGTFFYSAPERVEVGRGGAAVAKLAQGDFEGAIAEYKILIAENPTDRFPVMEVSKIYQDRLGNPDAAVNFLEDSLDDKDWPVDDAAFLMFRIADIELVGRGNAPRAREILTMIIDNMANTRHAANAQHKLDELETADRQPPRAAEMQMSDESDRLPPRTEDLDDGTRLPPRIEDLDDDSRLPPRT